MNIAIQPNVSCATWTQKEIHVLSVPLKGQGPGARAGERSLGGGCIESAPPAPADYPRTLSVRLQCKMSASKTKHRKFEMAILPGTVQ